MVPKKGSKNAGILPRKRLTFGGHKRRQRILRNAARSLHLKMNNLALLERKGKVSRRSTSPLASTEKCDEAVLAEATLYKKDPHSLQKHDKVSV